MDRRSLLTALVGIPLLRRGGPSRIQSSRTAPAFDPWVEVHRENLRSNVDAIARRTGRPVLAVVKNNAYGLGLELAGRVLDASPAVSGLAVVKRDEAYALRAAGVRKRVLLMGPFEASELADLASQGIVPMVYTPIGNELERVGGRLGAPIEIEICVDTGIGRVGVPVSRAEPLIRDLAARRGVRIGGLMMTFTEDPEFDPEQLRRFLGLTDRLRGSGLRLGLRHAASSYNLFGGSETFLDQVRPGMACYGVYPEPRFREAGALDLSPAVALRCRVIYVKRLEVGESAGYSRVFMPSEPTWVATLPMGHVDGVARIAVQGARVRIGAELYPVVAVSASHTIVALGPAERAAVGDVATWFDWSEGSRPEDVAAASKASVYDLLMHLNPALPRRPGD